MVVLGIDPGTASTGYGVVCRRNGATVALDGGVITTASDVPTPERLVQIHTRVNDLIEEHSPFAIAIEDIFFSVNVQTAFAVGRASGVVMLAAGEAGIPAYTYTPQAIKKGVCGSGNAEKGQVQRMVQTLLSLKELPRPDHAADALAVAICHSNTLTASGKSRQMDTAIGVK